MTDRSPSLIAVIHGEWVEEWNKWTVDQDRVVVWVQNLPMINEGDEATLSYFGPFEGETASVHDVQIVRIEAAHGGFHVVFNTGSEFVDDVVRLHPSDGIDQPLGGAPA